MTKSTLDSMFKYYSKKTGIKIHPHMLKHTHATELAREYIGKDEQINWEYIYKRLVHSTVTTTMETYAHLVSDSTDKDCLRYDLDGDTQLFLDHRIAKIAKDLVIPLAHLKDVKGINIFEKAILRQKERVKDLPPSSDGFKYLFREIRMDNRGLGTGKPI